MDLPRDPKLQEQLNRFLAESAAQEALFQHAVSFLAARRFVADLSASKTPVTEPLSRPSRLRSIRWLRNRVLRKRRSRQEAAEPQIIEGIVINRETAAPTGDIASTTSIVVVTIPDNAASEHDMST